MNETDAVEAYIAEQEDAIVGELLRRYYVPRQPPPCSVCNGDGHACTFDGVDLGPCSTCGGTGSVETP